MCRLFVDIRFTSFGSIPRTWLQKCIVGAGLVLWETAKLSSRVAVLFCIPTSREWEFMLFHVLVSIWCCQCSGFGALSKVCRHSSLFPFAFPWYSECGSLFHMIIFPPYIFFGDMSFQVLACFLIELFVFLYRILSFVCRFWIALLYQMCLFWAFLPVLPSHLYTLPFMLYLFVSKICYSIREILVIENQIKMWCKNWIMEPVKLRTGIIFKIK